MATWLEDIVEALRALGGSADYEQIYAEVAARRTGLPATWKQTIQGTIERASSDSKNYRAGRPDLFYAVRGIHGGAWGLRDLPGDHPNVADTGEPPDADGQGYAIDSVVRVAIEQHAVRRAVEHYQRAGATDVEELGKPFDLRVRLGGDEVHVEVKGSRRRLDAVTLTANEVEDARTTGTNHLFVVDQIDLATDAQGVVTASGGRQRVWTGWVPSERALTPTVYQYRLE